MQRYSSFLLACLFFVKDNFLTAGTELRENASLMKSRMIGPLWAFDNEYDETFF